jgi:phosphoserine phosphatase RsbU/P
MAASPRSRAAARLLVTDPSGNRTGVPLEALPFTIGRQPDSGLVVRDSRASRNHARIVGQDADYVLEDCESRHGTLVNGERVGRCRLRDGDRIEFGFPDSYQIVFECKSAPVPDSSIPAPATPFAVVPGASNLARLRALLEMARALENSGSTQDVLVSLVDAALALAGAERGFLLLKQAGELEVRVARDRAGRTLAEGELRVPRALIRRALERRRELLSMNFDQSGGAADRSVADLDLRSVVCVPLVRIRNVDSDSTNLLPGAADTAGVLYMDSRIGAADLSAGNREMLQSLAIEASIVLENARLLEEERARRRMDEELELARTIQQSLLPRTLPGAGWFRAAGSSLPSHQVGGDYFDVSRLDEAAWAVVVADVSGKGVGPALLASLLQGAFVAAPASASIAETFGRLNCFLCDHTEGEKYATLFYGRVGADGVLRYINAGHCPPLLVAPGQPIRSLAATAVPVGLLATADFPEHSELLEPRAKLVVYSDGVTEACGPSGDFFGKRRLLDIVTAHAGDDCEGLHTAICDEVRAFTRQLPQSDDITVVVVEYVPQ